MVTASDGDLHAGHQQEEGDEGPVVGPADAVAHPGAVVVKHVDTAVTDLAALEIHTQLQHTSSLTEQCFDLATFLATQLQQ